MGGHWKDAAVRDPTFLKSLPLDTLICLDETRAMRYSHGLSERYAAPGLVMKRRQREALNIGPGHAYNATLGAVPASVPANR